MIQVNHETIQGYFYMSTESGRKAKVYLIF